MSANICHNILLFEVNAEVSGGGPITEEYVGSNEHEDYNDYSIPIPESKY